MPSGLDDFYRGDTQIFRLTIRDEDGNPYDLTNCSIWFTMKKSPNDSDDNAIIRKKVTSHVNPTQGITEIRLEANETTTINPGKYVYDFQLVDSNGFVRTLLAGKVNVIPDITRSTT